MNHRKWSEVRAEKIAAGYRPGKWRIRLRKWWLRTLEFAYRATGRSA